MHGDDTEAAVLLALAAKMHADAARLAAELQKLEATTVGIQSLIDGLHEVLAEYPYTAPMVSALAEPAASLGRRSNVLASALGRLVAGRRRLEAVKTLGWHDVPVTVAKTLDDAHKALRAERDENTCRLDFTPSEAASIAKALEEFERAAAKERQAKAGPINGKGAKPTGVEKFSEAVTRGRALDRVAEAVGMSRPTLAKAQAVVEAAEADPKNYADLPAKMDQTRKVDPVYREMLERAEEHPIPDGPTPQQIAKASPAFKWSGILHGLFQNLNSIRMSGGIRKLVAKWSGEQRADYVRQLVKLKDEIGKTIEELEAARV